MPKLTTNPGQTEYPSPEPGGKLPFRAVSANAVALAKTLIDIGFDHKHVLLIMDEPTNHLDIEMVEWLENYLDQQNVTLLLVTHDRYFLDAVSNEIWEIDGSELFVYQRRLSELHRKKRPARKATPPP